jgi:hypothetical protein
MLIGDNASGVKVDGLSSAKLHTFILNTYFFLSEWSFQSEQSIVKHEESFGSKGRDIETCFLCRVHNADAPQVSLI